jgi:two-component system CheB/CheR fusion protein
VSAKPDAVGLETILEHIRSTRGFDFTGYKRATLGRRIGKRMDAVGVDDYEGYLDLLLVDPSEYEQLFNYILINVTGFFRDPEIWDFLRTDVLPAALKGRADTGPFRVWCAGCATGEEAYSLVMLLSEALGREAVLDRVKVYATDVDLEALAVARQGLYTAKQVESVPAQLRKTYFSEEPDGRFVFDKELRRSLIFGRHDLLQDAPISHVDILSCRNTLMYFNGESQSRIMSRFYFALAEGGILVLGKAEMMSGYAGAFSAIDLKRRIFSRGPKRVSRDRLLLLAQAGDQEALGQLTSHLRARELAFEGASVAQVMVDSSGILVVANARARELFGLHASDLGRPFSDLELSHRPAPLQALVEQAQKDHQRRAVTGAPWQAMGEHLYLDIEIVPLHDNGSRVLGVGIQFFDVSRERALRDELEQSNQELETAIEELQSTNEELETTNEELQSTNEELQTTNEELQATNEELETMNEELQSTNEELAATNEELRARTLEIGRLNHFLEAVTASVKMSIIVLDAGLRVRLWNRQSFEMWGLLEEEVLGSPFLGLDIGLPRDLLAPALMAGLKGDSSRHEFQMQATNRRGKRIVCRVAVSPMQQAGADSEGVILLVEQKAELPAGAEA